jgi:acyl-CoA synthetase (AMP-forming)/AMP-acid ligase II
MDRGSNTSIRSAYALPESGTVLTAEPASGEETSSSGYPLPYVSVYIVDPDSLEELLPGQLGEIIYSTPAQYDGYFDEGESRMIEGQDGRIYDRTGDLGLMDSDGNLTLIGRVEDRFVNDAGKKVYLTEMFTLLKSCKAFEDIKLVICDDDIVINYIENPMCEDTEDTLSELKRALIEAGFYKSQHTVFMKWDRFPEHGQLKALIKESADKELL